MKNNDYGRSMIEMLGVLAIVGVLSIGGIAGYSKAMMQYRINKTVEQIMTISSKLSAFGQKSSSYEGLDNAAAIKYNAFPSSLVVNSNTIQNAFGGTIDVEASSILGSVDNAFDNMAYTITYNNIPADACLSLASYDWGYSGNTSFIGIGIGEGGSDLKNSNEASENTAYAIDGNPMSISQAATACDCDEDCTFVIKFK